LNERFAPSEFAQASLHTAAESRDRLKFSTSRYTYEFVRTIEELMGNVPTSKY
jgi:hypothetical protein